MSAGGSRTPSNELGGSSVSDLTPELMLESRARAGSHHLEGSWAADLADELAESISQFRKLNPLILSIAKGSYEDALMQIDSAEAESYDETWRPIIMALCTYFLSLVIFVPLWVFLDSTSDPSATFVDTAIYASMKSPLFSMSCSFAIGSSTPMLVELLIESKCPAPRHVSRLWYLRLGVIVVVVLPPITILLMLQANQNPFAVYITMMFWQYSGFCAVGYSYMVKFAHDLICLPGIPGPASHSFYWYLVTALLFTLSNAFQVAVNFARPTSQQATSFRKTHVVFLVVSSGMHLMTLMQLAKRVYHGSWSPAWKTCMVLNASILLMFVSDLIVREYNLGPRESVYDVSYRNGGVPDVCWHLFSRGAMGIVFGNLSLHLAKQNISASRLSMKCGLDLASMKTRETRVIAPRPGPRPVPVPGMFCPESRVWLASYKWGLINTDIDSEVGAGAGAGAGAEVEGDSDVDSSAQTLRVYEEPLM